MNVDYAKRLNRSRCHLEGRLVWAQELCIRWGLGFRSVKEHRTLRGHVSDTPWTIDASSLCALQQKRLAAMMQTIATITVANCYTIFSTRLE